MIEVAPWIELGPPSIALLSFWYRMKNYGVMGLKHSAKNRKKGLILAIICPLLGQISMFFNDTGFIVNKYGFE